MNNMNATPSQTSGNAVITALLLFPVLFFFALVAIHAVNVPNLDDYDTVFKYLNTPGRLSPEHLLAQHNEHRIVFNRLVAEGLQLFSRSVDLRWLIYLGNASLAACLLLLFRQFRGTGLRPWYFLPVPFLVFNPGSWENMTWATCALQNNGVLLFAFLALHFRNRPGAAGMAAAALAGTLATFTSAGGILVFPVLLLAECLTPPPSTAAGGKAAVRLSVLFLAAASAAALYFHGYRPPENHAGLLQALLDPLHTVNFAARLLGSPFQPFGRAAVYAAGYAAVMLFAYLGAVRYDRRNPVLFYFCAFLLANAAVIAAGRSEFAVDMAFVSRYRIIPLLLLAAVYLALLRQPGPRLRRGLTAAAAAGALLLYTLATVSAGPELRLRQMLLARGMNGWPERPFLLYPDQQRARAILRNAVTAGYYIPPDSGEGALTPNG